MTTILYARVSTTDQEIGHQRTQAEAAGFRFDDVVSDDGVSGVSTRLIERDQGKRLFDILRNPGDTLVVRWVDRLGRNYEDVTETIKTFMDRGIVIETVIGRLKFNGSITDPMGKAIRDSQIAFLAAMGEAQADATKDAQKAGIEHAKKYKAHAYLGRKPKAGAAQLARVQELLVAGKSPTDIAKEVGISRAAVYRIKVDPARISAAVTRWSVERPA